MTRNILTLLECNFINRPDKTAVSYGDTNISFKDLYEGSKKVAAYLLRTVGSSVKAVGVTAERSPYTLMFFFGTLLSGNFYVPLDPEYPESKKDMILEDAGISVVLDSSFDFEAESDSDIPIPVIDDGTPLYLIYTSGSTGRPKGVLKSHRAMMSFINAYTETFVFNESDVIGNQTPFYFDASAKDIYLMLKTGATLDIIPQHLFAVPLDLINYLNERKVTFISWVPTALSIPARVNAFTVAVPKTLKKVFFVGEVMPVKYLKKWFDAMPDITYVNLYGSSEIAGICTYCIVTKDMLDLPNLPLGKPLGNCNIYLTGDDKIGEICIESDALASGYYHDEAKTSEKFVCTDPDGSGKFRRIFKTGDLAYYDEMGNLIFSSRSDFQIKHMGRRIELGEIESIADMLPVISRNVCLYNEARKQIVLFAELSDCANIGEKEIREMLKEKLSDYMLPGKIVIMEKLPINQNGKLDRQALKALL